MVDFKRMLADKAKPLPQNPRDIFNSLPRPEGINELYVSQAEVLDAWWQRRAEQDIVMKLHTGGGKTLVAMLMAQSTMNELNEPVLYLAPTNQLVDQVLAMGKHYGIAATPYVKGQPLAAEFLDGKSVLVGSYETLFNGRSKFGVRGSGVQPTRVGAIIMDDAHVALQSVRDSFTLTVTTRKSKEVYQHLSDMFRGSFFDIGRSGAFADITRDRDHGVLEVPSWAWQRKLPEVQEYLSHVVNDIDPYVWPFLRDNLAVCHCLISARSITITPIFPPVDLLPTFDDAKRRIYVSATIADDSDIIRTFGAAAGSVSKPVTSVSLAGVGERMILVPQLMELGNTAIMPMIKLMAKAVSNQYGALILTPSGPAAQTWKDTAIYPDNSTAVAEQITAMQAGKQRGPLVLANRYDGIDLKGDACRLLVMDGIPMGTSDYELFRADVMSESAINNYLAQRIEQGIGRGTRGGSDFCVVVLTGARLVAWVGRRTSLAHLTTSTRVQLELGQDISSAVTSPKEFYETANKCLGRDPDWVTYHASELAAAAKATGINPSELELVGTERRAFRLQRLGQHQNALNTLDAAMAKPEVAGNQEVKAWLSALASRIASQMGDDVAAQRYQTAAFSMNNNHTPPVVRPRYMARPRPGRQALAIVDLLLSYQRRIAILADFDDAVTSLVPEASSNQYEESLRKLGGFIGFRAERPEKEFQVGPDVLWLTDANFDFVIEAKSEKEEKNPLYKNDHAQLLESEQWFRKTYEGRNCVRVSALPVPRADSKATTDGTFALTLQKIATLSGAVRELLSVIAQQQGDRPELEERCEAELRRLNLTPDGIKLAFLVPFQ